MRGSCDSAWRRTCNTRCPPPASIDRADYTMAARLLQQHQLPQEDSYYR